MFCFLFILGVFFILTDISIGLGAMCLVFTGVLFITTIVSVVTMYDDLTSIVALYLKNINK